MKLPQKESLRPLARELRKNSTLAEVLLWNQLKNKQFFNLDFDRQKSIGNYIVDFYCPALNLVVEIDGNSHDNKLSYDLNRDDYFNSLGLQVIHFADRDVKNNIGVVLEYIGRFITTTPSVNFVCRDTPSRAKGINSRDYLNTKHRYLNSKQRTKNPLLVKKGWTRSGRGSCRCF